MGRAADLSASEKSTIIRHLGAGKKIKDIAAEIKRSGRTIKRFVNNSNHKRVRSDRGKNKCISSKEFVQLKRTVASMTHETSKNIFLDAVGKLPSRSTRCRILQQIAKIKKGQIQPKLTLENKKCRKAWAKKYMKLDWRHVIFTDECRISCDGPDSFKRGWVREGWQPSTFNRRQQRGGSVMFWLAIHGENILGPFKIDGNLNSHKYCELLESKFMPYVHSFSKNDQKKLVLMQDNAPSHASNYTSQFLDNNKFKENRFMEWPSNSPDLNPIENLFSRIKSDLYKAGTSYSNKNDLWTALKMTIHQIDKKLVSSLTTSMDSRVIQIFEKKGAYINH